MVCEHEGKKVTKPNARRIRVFIPHWLVVRESELQDMEVSFKVFASIIVAEKKKLMLAAVFNAKCGGILGKSLIIPLNVAVSEGLPPFGVLKHIVSFFSVLEN